MEILGIRKKKNILRPASYLLFCLALASPAVRAEDLEEAPCVEIAASAAMQDVVEHHAPVNSGVHCGPAAIGLQIDADGIYHFSLACNTIYGTQAYHYHVTFCRPEYDTASCRPGTCQLPKAVFDSVLE